ncbi:MAG TPA: hypothetical protein DCO86_03120 [Spirochaetaceae bacterium]|nr:hypothetical protein [Spirochaetaceae bacterium]
MPEHFAFSIFAKSFAKLNLSLEIGKYVAKAGMHMLQSQMVLIDFHEILLFRIELFPNLINCFDFQIMPHEQCCPAVEDNLMFKAACKWHEMRKIGLNMKIWHDDNVPTGRGFGIASSNASELIKALEKCFSALMSESTGFTTTSDSFSEIKELCSLLGSDVPFFYYGRANSFVSGFGETIAPLKDDKKDRRFVIAIPPFHSNTPNAYKCLYENGERKYNDFEHLEANVKAKKMLREITGATNWKTTGSGAAQFIENPSPELLRKIRNIQKNKICDFRFVEATQLLPSTRLELA